MTSTRQPKFVDIHVLHSVPFSNLNRDDNGAPKTVRFGDRNRARISSQCQKRAARIHMQNNDAAIVVGAARRTRRLPTEVAEHLEGTAAFTRGLEKAKFAAAAVFGALGINPYKGDLGETDILTFLPAGAGERIADVISAAVNSDDEIAAFFEKRYKAHAKATGKKRGEQFKGTVKGLKADFKEFVADVQAVFEEVNPVIALTGRMSTALPGSTVDGAVQVAHAFTTHTSSNEPDFFTAVDDHPAEDTGAGHMGDSDYVTGVFYQYASIDILQFRKNCKIDDQTAAEAVAAFVESFAEAASGAKKTGTAPHTPPSLVMVNIRADRQVNYANAFERPIAADRRGGFIEPSVKALVKKSKRRTDGIVKSWIDLEDDHGLLDLPEQTEQADIFVIADRVRDFFAAGPEVSP